MNKSKKFARRSVARGFAASLTMLSALGALAPTKPAQAQITAAPDGTGTLVNVNGNQIDISGGTQAGANLFQSFQQFGLSQTQIANFLSNPSIANILARVSGGDPSVINGLIQVSGSNANLFLMNPAGVIFGPNAQLNVPASFTATTANAIGVGDAWFNATGTNDFSKLGGDPSSLAFTMNQPGAIINTGNLAVGQGKDLTVAGGSVISTGTLSAPGGNLLVTALPGGSFLRISQAGSPLSIDIPANPNQWDRAIPTLASMVANIPSGATGVEVRDGKVYLAGSDIQFRTGDALVQQAAGGNVNLFAANNLFSAPVTGPAVLSAAKNLDIATGNNVVIRDTKAAPFLAIAGEQLNVTGVNGVDIWALNHQSLTPFQSGGDLAIASNGIISGDAHFTAAGQTSFLKMNGEPGEFVSYYDPIISSTKDVKMGNYTGASLKIETLGKIYTGNINITTPDVGLTGSDPDIAILTSSPALILRAGLTSLANPVNLGTQDLLLASGGTVIHTLYGLTAMGVPGGFGQSGATVRAMNASGEMVGYAYYSGSNVAAVGWKPDGTPYSMGILPGYPDSDAYDISATGNVATISIDDALNLTRAGLFDPGYGQYDLGALPGGTSTRTYAISSNGWLVGTSNDATMTDHVVLWSPAGVMSDLGTAQSLMPGKNAVYGYDINNSLAIVGQGTFASPGIASDSVAFFRDGTTGAMTYIPVLPGDTQNIAYGINDNNVVVGTSFNGGYDYGINSNAHAFMFKPGQGVTALGTLPGDTYSQAFEINNNNVAVGFSGRVVNGAGVQTATIFSNGTAIDVNQLIDENYGIQVASAVAINDNGQIAAQGTLSGQVLRLDPQATTDGGISVGSITTAGGPVILDGPKVELRGDIRTNGGDVLIQQSSPVTINKAGLYDTLTINSAGGDITLNGAIDQVPGRMNSLSVLAGDGTITTNGAIGSLAMPNLVALRGSGVNVNAPIRSLSGIAIGADTLSLQGTLSTTQDVTLEPYTAGRNVGIARDGGPGAWNLDQAALLQLQPGVNRLNIGGAWVGTNTVSLGTPTLNVPLNIKNTNLLFGPDVNSTWTIVGGSVGEISGYNQRVTFEGVRDMLGGSGNDTFKLLSTGATIGFTDGGGGTNTLDYSMFGSPVTVMPGNMTPGTATKFFGGILHFQNVVGGITDIQNGISSLSDRNTIQGTDTNNTFTVTGANQGDLNGVTFQNFGNLKGGNQGDTFVFNPGAYLAGSIDGGAGTGLNSLDYSNYGASATVKLGDQMSGTATAVAKTIININDLVGDPTQQNTLLGRNSASTYTITGANSGVITGVDYQDPAGSTYKDFQTLQAGSGNDTFILAGGSQTRMDGGVGTDSLVGDNLVTNTFDLTGPDSGTVANANGTSAFQNIENLTGGSQDDTVHIASGGSLSGNLDGSPGSDTLDYTGNTNNVTVDLGAGTATGITGSLTSIENYKGGAGNNTLIGTAGADAFTITANNQGTVGSIGFNGFESLQGSGGDDTFTLDGGVVQSLDGGTGNDYLIGDDVQNNTFTLTGADSGTVANGYGTAAFASIENLTGGAGISNNTFQMVPGGTLSGNIQGAGTGTNSLDYSNYGASATVKLGDLTPGTATAIAGTIQHINDVMGNANYLNTLMGPDVGSTFTITGPGSGVVTGPGSGPAGDTFRNFNDVVGGTGDDIFVLDGGMITNIIGGDGSDRLVGDHAVPNTFNLSGLDSGTVANANGMANFSSIENLSGGDQPDTFKVIGNGSLTGSIDGAPGSDTLDYSSYVGQVSVNLGTGEATAIGGVMTSIENLIGNSTPGNELIGPDADANWEVTGPRTGHVTDLSNGNRTNFQDFDVLQGGTASDRFNLPIDGGVTQIGGGAGSDVLNLPKGSSLNQAGTSGTANGATFASIEQVNLPVDPIVLPGLNSSTAIPALEPVAFDLSAFRNLRDSAHAALDGDAEDSTFACANPEETEVALAKERKPNRFARVKDQVLACFRGKHDKKTKTGKQQPVVPVQPQSAAPALFPLAMAPVEQQQQPQSDAHTAQPAASESAAQPEQVQAQQLDTYQTNFSEGYSAQTKPFSKQAPKMLKSEVVQ